jgi:hypothetical protein
MRMSGRKNLASEKLIFHFPKWGKRLVDPNLKYFNLTMGNNAVGIVVVPTNSRTTSCYKLLPVVDSDTIRGNSG